MMLGALPLECSKIMMSSGVMSSLSAPISTIDFVASDQTFLVDLFKSDLIRRAIISASKSFEFDVELENTSICLSNDFSSPCGLEIGIIHSKIPFSVSCEDGFNS